MPTFLFLLPVSSDFDVADSPAGMSVATVTTTAPVVSSPSVLAAQVPALGSHTGPRSHNIAPHPRQSSSRIRLRDTSDELEDITAGAYQRLLVYRKACAKSIEELMATNWLPNGERWCWIVCPTCVKHRQTGNTSARPCAPCLATKASSRWEYPPFLDRPSRQHRNVLIAKVSLTGSCTCTYVIFRSPLRSSEPSNNAGSFGSHLCV
ncbi:hypothetical protein K466DRAFT_590944 [Polyporus arcularius HHB13444]|uniref:Uncharacterized protein n=1 Tax=Polyporus arcularius HHB13444 TaxID=1314778 RepID=A0A5C3P7X3_9APHY|nr:hypothetical protein K466DRAFT_590944 [Polyporus arcularius HHB13444]